MCDLWKEGMYIRRAAENAVQKMEPPRPSEARAIDRLLKKFPKFRAEKELVESERAEQERERAEQERERAEQEREKNQKASRPTSPQSQASISPLTRIREQAQRYHEFRITPEGRAAVEHLRQFSEDKLLRDLMRDAAESVRWARENRIL
jgi:hypothetical protein